MKRFLVLLVVLAGGVAWAAFSISSNAATVNGTTISQQDLNSDVSAIANSAYYQCYLNSEEYISSEGSEQAPPVLGAGTGSTPGTTRPPPPPSWPAISRPTSVTSWRCNWRPSATSA
jgi:hypothetical protein